MREARRAHSKDEDAPERHAGEEYGQFMADTAGAGYKCWTHEARICVSVRRLDSRVAYSGRDQIGLQQVRDQIEKCVFNESEWL